MAMMMAVVGVGFWKRKRKKKKEDDSIQGTVVSSVALLAGWQAYLQAAAAA